MIKLPCSIEQDLCFRHINIKGKRFHETEITICQAGVFAKGQFYALSDAQIQAIKEFINGSN